MRFQIAPLLLAASISGAVAMPQTGSITALSTCVQTRFTSLVQELLCSALDIACLCQKPGIITTITNAVTASCGASDADAAVAFGRAQCAAAGFNLAAAPATSSAAPESTSTTVVGSMTVTSTLMPASSATATSSMAASIAPFMPTMAPASNATWNSTMISPSPFTGSADSVKMGGIAAGLLGVAVAFAML